jgi:hypothetical protein
MEDAFVIASGAASLRGWPEFYMIGREIREASLRARQTLAVPLDGGYSSCVRKRILIAAVAALMQVPAGCAHIALPPQVTLTEVEPSGRAAKPPDCNLPILRTTPLAAYREVAIIEGVGNRYVHEEDVLPLVARKACETGADAIVVRESRSQTSENLTGYYVNAIAIVYKNEKEGGAVSGSNQPILH